MATKQSNEDIDEQVVWTSNMPERREGDRRSGYDRRQCQGRPMNVPSFRKGGDRRKDDRRKTVSLVITGRALNA